MELTTRLDRLLYAGSKISPYLAPPAAAAQPPGRRHPYYQGFKDLL